MLNLDSALLKKYGVEVIRFANLPDTPPHGFWVISEDCIIPCTNKNCTHYGTALIVLSSLGIKKFNVRLEYIIRQYNDLETFHSYCNLIGSSYKDKVMESDKVSFEEVFYNMYSTPINAVRVYCNKDSVRGFNSIDIITPYPTNKKALSVAKDICLLYDKNCNFHTDIV